MDQKTKLRGRGRSFSSKENLDINNYEFELGNEILHIIPKSLGEKQKVSWMSSKYEVVLKCTISRK